MKRRQWLRDCAMALAVSLLPKVLRPAEPEVVGESVEYGYGEIVVPDYVERFIKKYGVDDFRYYYFSNGDKFHISSLHK